LRKIQILLEDEDAFQRLQEEENVLREILNRLNWEVSEDLKVSQILLPRLENESAVALPDPFLESELKWREETSRLNFQRFHTYTAYYAPQMLEERRVADHIKQTFGRDAAAVQEFVQRFDLDKLSVVARVEGKPPKESTLLAVQTTENDPFFYGVNGLEGELRARFKLSRERIDDNHPVMSVNLENPYKFIALHTEEVHPLKHYRGWSECEAAYLQHIRNEYHELNPVHLHIFSAEALAAELERRLVLEKGLAYKALSPRVVLLLEDRKRLHLFFWLWALDHIRETPKEVLPYRWELSLEEIHPLIWLTPGWEPHQAGQEKHPRPGLLEAIHGFVIHGVTFEPGRSWRIQYDKLEDWLHKYQRQLPREELIAFLKRQIDESEPGSLAHRLKMMQERADNEVEQDEYESLLRILQLLFEDEIQWWTS